MSRLGKRVRKSGGVCVEVSNVLLESVLQCRYEGHNSKNYYSQNRNSLNKNCTVWDSLSIRRGYDNTNNSTQ